MRVIEVPEKNYSWLQWPVRLNHFAGTGLHITAKFFGSIPIDRNAVIARVPLQESLWFSNEFQWSREMFSQHMVLELTKYPPAMRDIHNRFDLIEDEFKPWRPHITVTREYWQSVHAFGFTPESEKLTIGEIELCIGTKIERL